MRRSGRAARAPPLEKSGPTSALDCCDSPLRCVWVVSIRVHSPDCRRAVSRLVSVNELEFSRAFASILPARNGSDQAKERTMQQIV